MLITRNIGLILSLPFYQKKEKIFGHYHKSKKSDATVRDFEYLVALSEKRWAKGVFFIGRR